MHKYTNDLFSNKLIHLLDLINKMETGDIVIHIPGNVKQNVHYRILINISNLKDKYTFIDIYFHVLSYSINKLTLKAILLFITYYWGYDRVTLIRFN